MQIPRRGIRKDKPGHPYLMRISYAHRRLRRSYVDLGHANRENRIDHASMLETDHQALAQDNGIRQFRNCFSEVRKFAATCDRRQCEGIFKSLRSDASFARSRSHELVRTLWH